MAIILSIIAAMRIHFMPVDNLLFTFKFASTNSQQTDSVDKPASINDSFILCVV